MSLFCVYPVFHWCNIVENVLPKAGGLGKKIKRGDGHITAVRGGSHSRKFFVSYKGRHI